MMMENQGINQYLINFGESYETWVFKAEKNDRGVLGIYHCSKNVRAHRKWQIFLATNTKIMSTTINS